MVQLPTWGLGNSNCSKGFGYVLGLGLFGCFAHPGQLRILGLELKTLGTGMACAFSTIRYFIVELKF